MIKMTLTFEDFSEPPKTVTDTYEFHLSKADLVKMELSAEGNSMLEYMRRISKASSGKETIKVMEEIVDKAYGVRTLEGGFRKTPEVLQKFKDSGAYDALFEQLLTSDEADEVSLKFIRGLFPAAMQEEIPDNVEDVRKVVSGDITVPAGVRMPSDRQPKHSEPKAFIVENVPFMDSNETTEIPGESIEMLEARLEAARAAKDAQ